MLDTAASGARTVKRPMAWRSTARHTEITRRRHLSARRGRSGSRSPSLLQIHQTDQATHVSTTCTTGTAACPSCRTVRHKRENGMLATTMPASSMTIGITSSHWHPTALHRNCKTSCAQASWPLDTVHPAHHMSWLQLEYRNLYKSRSFSMFRIFTCLWSLAHSNNVARVLTIITRSKFTTRWWFLCAPPGGIGCCPSHLCLVQVKRASSGGGGVNGNGTGRIGWMEWSGVEWSATSGKEGHRLSQNRPSTLSRGCLPSFSVQIALALMLSGCTCTLCWYCLPLMVTLPLSLWWSVALAFRWWWLPCPSLVIVRYLCCSSWWWKLAKLLKSWCELPSIESVVVVIGLSPVAAVVVVAFITIMLTTSGSPLSAARGSGTNWVLYLTHIFPEKHFFLKCTVAMTCIPKEDKAPIQVNKPIMFLILSAVREYAKKWVRPNL